MRDDQRRAMFASMANSYAREPRVVVPKKEDFLKVDDALAFNSDVVDQYGNEYEISGSNVFALPIHELEKMSTFRGSKIADIAQDVLDIKRGSYTYTSSGKRIPVLPKYQGVLDISELDSLKKYGLAKDFKGETIESVEAGLPEELNVGSSWDQAVDYVNTRYPIAVVNDDILPEIVVNNDDYTYPMTVSGGNEVGKAIPLESYDDGIIDADYNVIEDGVEFEQRSSSVEDFVIDAPTTYPDVNIDEYRTSAEKEIIERMKGYGVSEEEFLRNVEDRRASDKMTRNKEVVLNAREREIGKKLGDAEVEDILEGGL